MFMMKMPRRAKPRITSSVKIRSRVETGSAEVVMERPLFSSFSRCQAAVYARGCAHMPNRRLFAAGIVTLFPLVSAAAVPATFDAAAQELGRDWLVDNGGVG